MQLDDSRDKKVSHLITNHKIYIIVALISTLLLWSMYFQEKNYIYLCTAIVLLIATIIMIFNYKSTKEAIKIKYGKKERKEN